MDGNYLSLLLVPLVYQLRAVLMVKLLFAHVLTINDYHIYYSHLHLCCSQQTQDLKEQNCTLSFPLSSQIAPENRIRIKIPTRLATNLELEGGRPESRRRCSASHSFSSSRSVESTQVSLSIHPPGQGESQYKRIFKRLSNPQSRC